jgi:alkylation response protein AidB-like acyl-CoA dehydrogenase
MTTFAQAHCTEPELLDSALRWARDAAAAAFRSPPAAHDAAREAALWADCAALGWADLLVPETLGGPEGTLAQACALAQALGQAQLALPWLEHAVLAVGTLRACPPCAARDKLLQSSATQRLALAAFEPGRRADMQPETTTARAVPGGYLLQGHKVFCGGGAQAQILLVSARRASTADGADIALFAVPASPAARPAGLAITDHTALDGRRIAQVHLDSVFLPAQALLASAGAASHALREGADTACLALCAEACGLADQALSLTLDHLKTRQQFGQPLARFQALQHRAADMAVACEYAAAMTWGTVADLDTDITEAHRSARVSAAKAEVLRLTRFVLEQAIQLHGGMGITDEVAVSRGFKRLVVLDAWLGDRDFHLQRVAAHSLGEALVDG